MRCITIRNDDIETPATYIARCIRTQLAEQKSVLWVVPGGSAIKVAVRARELLGGLTSQDKLHVVLSDERYGAVNHADSNAKQLADAGFDTTGLQFYSVLTGDDVQTTSRRYDDIVKNLSETSNTIVGLLGMGKDGHTAGLLPGNPLVGSVDDVGNFQSFDYKRITTTPAFLRRLDEAVIYAIGEDKWPVISQLETTDLPVAVLRGAQNLTVYSDYKGEQ